MKMPVTVRIPRPLVFGAILAAAPFLYADEAMDRLVKLVGRDAGLCVEIPHLDETLSSFEQGEFFHRLTRSQIYAEWKTGSQYRGVAGLAAAVEKLTGKPARQFVAKIFGTAVVVAAYAEPGPKMSAVLMSETMSKGDLRRPLTFGTARSSRTSSRSNSRGTRITSGSVPPKRDAPRSPCATRPSIARSSSQTARSWSAVR